MLLWVGRRRCWTQKQALRTEMQQLKTSVPSVGGMSSTEYLFPCLLLLGSSQQQSSSAHTNKNHKVSPSCKGLRMHSHVHRTATNRFENRPDHSPVGALAHALQMQDCPTVMRPASRNVLAPRSNAVAKTSRTARRAPHPANGVKEHNCLLEAVCSSG